ncbi:Hypothetical predicted protein, partial [Paramuricea clavata]
VISVGAVASALQTNPDASVFWRRCEPGDLVHQSEAATAATNSAHRIVVDSRVDPSTNRRHGYQWMRSQWVSRWQKSNEYRQTKYWFPEPVPELSAQILRKSRDDFGLRVQFLTGHGWLQRHKWIVKESEDDSCRLCRDGPEEPYHLFMECSSLASDRRNILGMSRTSIGDWSIRELDRFLDLPLVRNLHESLPPTAESRTPGAPSGASPLGSPAQEHG